VVNKPDHGTLDWVKICEKSSKVITFIDLAGHERYLKTTVFGMTGHAPDFGMLMVSFFNPLTAATSLGVKRFRALKI
jgi:GTPase